MPGDYTAPDTLVVGDPIRASWIAVLLTALQLFEDRFFERPIPLQAAVAGVQSASYVDVPYPLEWTPTQDGDASVTYYSKAVDAATAVQLQLYDVTAAAAVSGSQSTANTDTADWTTESLVVSVVTGHVYRLQMKGSNATNPVLGYATIL